MKNILVLLSFFFVLNSMADIEYSPDQSSQPTQTEILRNRSCWEELTIHGCGDPGENPKHFLSCLKEVKSSLTDNCKEMMIELYGD